MPISAECHISSLVVHARAARAAGVSSAIDSFAHAEVRAVDGAGKLVVLLETEDEGQILDSIRRIESIDGVLSAALVYHEIDTGGVEHSAGCGKRLAPGSTLSTLTDSTPPEPGR